MTDRDRLNRLDWAWTAAGILLSILVCLWFKSTPWSLVKAVVIGALSMWTVILFKEVFGR